MKNLMKSDEFANILSLRIQYNRSIKLANFVLNKLRYLQHLWPKVAGSRSPWCSFGKHRCIQRSMAGMELSWHRSVQFIHIKSAFGKSESRRSLRIQNCDKLESVWFLPYTWMQNVSETDSSPVTFDTWFSCLYKGLFKNGNTQNYLMIKRLNHDEPSCFHDFQTFPSSHLPIFANTHIILTSSHLPIFTSSYLHTSLSLSLSLSFLSFGRRRSEKAPWNGQMR